MTLQRLHVLFACHRLKAEEEERLRLEEESRKMQAEVEAAEQIAELDKALRVRFYLFTIVMGINLSLAKKKLWSLVFRLVRGQ